MDGACAKAFRGRFQLVCISTFLAGDVNRVLSAFRNGDEQKPTTGIIFGGIFDAYLCLSEARPLHPSTNILIGMVGIMISGLLYLRAPVRILPLLVETLFRLYG